MKIKNSKILHFKLSFYILLFTFCVFVPVGANALTLGKPSNFLAINSGLVGWWTFDGKDTPWTSATAATTLDKSGQGNTGTLTNMNQATAPTPGKLGQALKFDGVDDIVLGGSDFISTGADSIAAWIKPISLGEGGTGRIIDNGQVRFYLSSSNTLSFSSDGGVTVANSASSVISLNTWNFVVVTRDSTGVANLYVNGVLSGNANQSSGTPAGGSTNVQGGNNSAGSATFDGSIDDVRVYNRALSASEILQLYNLGAASKIASTPKGIPNQGLNSGLVGWWTFDGKDTPWTSATAATTLDKSGQGNTGTLTNMNQATAPTPGKLGQALKFDGVNDYVKGAAYSSTLDLLGTSFTLSAWVKPTSQAVSIIVDKPYLDGAHDSPFFDWALVYNANSDGKASVFMACNAVHKYNNTSLVVGAWNHIVATYNGSAINFYLNGLADGTPAQTCSVTNTNSAPFRIGSNGLAGENFPGTTDDVRIYNRALSASEILQLYNLSR